MDEERLLIADLVLCEVLQGLRDEAEAAAVEASLRRFEPVELGGHDIAVKAAANYRLLRSAGITVRKTIDLIIGTWCAQNGHGLLHDDRDFDLMAPHIGLRVV